MYNQYYRKLNDRTNEVFVCIEIFFCVKYIIINWNDCFVCKDGFR